ncbi:hypothetical protein PCNPT3_08965 [Psychromonas sp. CNPT3]|uniref:YceI family protein n=1 Tax=Psychromonas sp. CNPT3 TaxID=314282 RepID=UPI00006E6163|nr:YceI family protein [Psychromonas sp. CNPT3]AGH81731.1 hypothetical protein PCNPT3_08965 [Psychromonas sp. CNPT3]
MKKILLSSVFCTLLLFINPSFASEYKIDSKGAHASINFKISHLGFSFITGRFNTFSGTFNYDKNKIENASIKVKIDTSSINSNHAERDKHIRSSDFINVKKFNQATFESTNIKKEKDGMLSITGNFTLHGVTKEIRLDGQFIGEGKDPWGGYRAGFTASTRLYLKDFNIKVLGNSNYVDIDLNIEGIRQ